MRTRLHLVGLVIVGSAVTAAQLDGQGGAFEVASVRPNRSADAVPRLGFPPGGFEAVAATVQQLISYAYADDGRPLRPSQIVGGPDWITAARFDIVAKAVPSPSSPQLMIRALLADRFGLVARADTRELPVYELRVARNDRTLGPRLRQAPLDCAARAAQAPPGTPGFAVCGGDRGPTWVTGRSMPIGILASGSLPPVVDRVVVDRTGLDGIWDWDLEWADAGPSVFTALQEQLGLTLESARAPVPVIVIDRVERPTEN